MDQPCKVANPARGQLNRENNIPLSPCVPENLVSRDGFSCPVPRQPAHLDTQAESGAYLRDSFRVLKTAGLSMVHNATYNHVIGIDPCVSSSLFIALGRMSLPRVALHNNIRYVPLGALSGCYAQI